MGDPLDEPLTDERVAILAKEPEGGFSGVLGRSACRLAREVMRNRKAQEKEPPSRITTRHVGRTLYGYCGGFFGRDSYDDKTIIAVGEDFVTVREETSRGLVRTAQSGDGWDVHDALFEYLQPEPDYG